MVAVRGWLGLYRTSVGLGLRYLVRHGYLREAVIRVVVPLEPIRYVELPDSLRELGARPEEEIELLLREIVPSGLRPSIPEPSSPTGRRSE